MYIRIPITSQTANLSHVISSKPIIRYRQKNIPNIILYYNQESYAVRTDTLINWENQNQKIMPLYPGYLAQLDKQ